MANNKMQLQFALKNVRHVQVTGKKVCFLKVELILT